MNVHPALIPSFCGKGMYGHHVHEAVIERGVKFSGATVHLVDEEYDTGPIVLQTVVPCSMTTHRIRSRRGSSMPSTRPTPKPWLWFADDRLEVVGRKVRVRAGGNSEL